MEDRLLSIKKELLDGMLDYISDINKEHDYTKVDVEIVDKLIDTFIYCLEKIESPTEQIVMENVKNFVLSLNSLNEISDFSLIETDQRELLCDLIFVAVKNTGIKVSDEDFTEQWREW